MCAQASAALGTIDLDECISAGPSEYYKEHGGCTICFEVCLGRGGGEG